MSLPNRVTSPAFLAVYRRRVLIAVVLASGCGGVSEQPTKPEVPVIVPARIRVTLEREGNGRDADGVTVSVDGRQRTLQEGAAVVFDSVTPGASMVRFSGLAPQCVGSADSVAASVGTGATTDVSLRIHCVGGLIFMELAASGGRVIQFLHEDGRVIALTPAGTVFPDVFAPDGSRILFSDRGSVGGVPTAHLFSVRVDGSELRQLTSGDVSDTRPRWSPDGTRVAFYRLKVVGGGYDPVGLMMMNADGSNLHPIIDSPRYDYDPVWAKDGSKIYFGCSRFQALADLCVVSPDGSGLRRIPLPSISAIDNDCVGYCIVAGPQHFEISPDGTALSIETNVTPGRGSNGIWVLPLGAADATYVTAGMVGFDARWSPGSDQVLFEIGGKPNEYAIGTVSRTGSGFRHVTPFDGGVTQSADWSTDGALLAYDRYGPEGQQAMIIKPDGTGARPITAGPLMHTYARWSPLARPGMPSFPVARSADVSVTPRASASRAALASEAKTYPLLGNSKCAVTMKGAETQVACAR